MNIDDLKHLPNFEDIERLSELSKEAKEQSEAVKFAKELHEKMGELGSSAAASSRRLRDSIQNMYGGPVADLQEELRRMAEISNIGHPAQKILQDMQEEINRNRRDLRGDIDSHFPELYPQRMTPRPVERIEPREFAQEKVEAILAEIQKHTESLAIGKCLRVIVAFGTREIIQPIFRAIDDTQIEVTGFEGANQITAIFDYRQLQLAFEIYDDPKGWDVVH